MTKNSVLRLASIGLLLSTAITNACVLSTDDPDDDTTGTGTTSSSSTGSSTGSDTSGTPDSSGSNTSSTSGSTDDSSGSSTSTPELTECNRDLLPSLTITEGNITANQVWSGVVAIDTSLYVSNAEIKIEPGTTILVNQDAKFVFGYTGAATILAQGTAEAPIHICGKKVGSSAAHWKGLSFSDKVATNSALQNVIIEDAGTLNEPAIDSDVALLVQNVAVSGSQGVGVRASNFQAASAGLTVTESGTYPVEITGQGALTNFPVGGAFTDNATNRILVSATTIDATTTVHDAGIPYEQESKLYQSKDTLTFEAGVEYLFGPDSGIVAGYTGGATLMVNGTADNKVHFGGTSSEPGWWHGIDISAMVTSNSTLSYLDLTDAGGGSYFSLGISAPIKLDHVNVGNGTNGVEIKEQGLSNASTMLSITGMAGVPAEIHPSAIFTLPADGSYTGNGNDAVQVNSDYIEGSGQIKKLNVPYLIAGVLYQAANSKISVAAGTTFNMAPDSGIEVSYGGGGEFIAVGTAAEPITFTAVDESAGSWRAINVAESALSSSKFDYVTLAYGGGDLTAMLQLGKPLAVTNSTFKHSATYGIAKRASDATDYTATNTFEGNASGNVTDY